MRENFCVKYVVAVMTIKVAHGSYVKYISPALVFLGCKLLKGFAKVVVNAYLAEADILSEGACNNFAVLCEIAEASAVNKDNARY